MCVFALLQFPQLCIISGIYDDENAAALFLFIFLLHCLDNAAASLHPGKTNSIEQTFLMQLKQKLQIHRVWKK